MKDPHFSTNRRHMIAFKKPNVGFRYKFHNKIKLCKRAKNWKLCCLETKTDACDKASKGRKHTGKYIMHFRCQPCLTHQFHFLDSSSLICLRCFVCFSVCFFIFFPLSQGEGTATAFGIPHALPMFCCEVTARPRLQIRKWRWGSALHFFHSTHPIFRIP
jgi:hypothetical protein